MFIGRALVGLATLFAAIPIRAFAQPQPPPGFIRTHFTVDDGLPGGVIDEIAQTPDGFLWVRANAGNLTRFDGRAFYMLERGVTSLVDAPDGGLWIGKLQGLIHVSRDNLHQFTLSAPPMYHPGPGEESHVTRLRVGRGGVLWVGTGGGLFRYDGTQFVPLGPRVGVKDIEETRDGHVLLATEGGFVELDGSTVVPHPGLAATLGLKEPGFGHVLEDSRGNIWYSTVLGVARETGGHIEKLGTYGGIGHAAWRTYEDAEGVIWIAKDEGLFRVTASGLELIAPGLQARALFSDGDGNLWVGTNGDGLYRFRRSAVRMFTKEDDLPNNTIQTVMTGRDGTVWTGANCGGLSRFDGTRFHTYSEREGLLNSCVWAIAEDANRDLWVGTWGGGAFRFHDGSFTQISKKDGLADDRVTSIVAAPDGTMWFGTRTGVSRLRAGQITNLNVPDGGSAAATFNLREDRSGVLWVGSENGLSRLVGDRFELFAPATKSTIVPIGADPNGGFLIADGDRDTVFRIDEDRAVLLAGFPVVADMVATAQGDLWFGGAPIVRVPRGAFALARAPDEPLDYVTFSVADGLATSEASTITRCLALTPDGRLWVATPKGLAMFDLSRLPIVTSKPSVYLTRITIGRNTARPGPEIVLPAGTNHLQIDFGAVEVSSPEKIGLQYRLDDVDAEWLDAGPNPHAIYSTLPPGKHVLHIRASNRSGIWDRQGVVFSVTQQPFFYQTHTFVAVVSVVTLMLVVVGYRVRLRQISRALSARFDERLGERTRMAREVHDTLLQTVQASKMVAEHAMTDVGDHERMTRAMGQLSAWLERATEEGRAALHSLRVSTTETNDLAEAFRRAIDECRGTSNADVSFSVQGASREIHPVVRDEVYRIAYEAIRNACAHSGGTRIEVELRYSRDLVVRVADNGAGMHASTVERGRAGHFGLQGMRERVARIGARLNVVSVPGTGTEIALTVPGRVAFVRDTSPPPTKNYR